MVELEETQNGSDFKAIVDEVLLSEDKPEEFVLTNNISLDILLTRGKGVPMGSSLLFFGKNNSFKSELGLDTAVRVLKKKEGAKALYLTMEESTPYIDTLCSHYNVNKDRILVKQVSNWQQIEAIFMSILNGEEPYTDVKFIVVKEIKEFATSFEVEPKKDYGAKSRVISVASDKFLPLFKQRGITTIFTQSTEKPMPVTAHVLDIIIHFSKVNDIVYLSAGGENCRNRYNFSVYNRANLFLDGNNILSNFTVINMFLLAKKLSHFLGDYFTLDDSLAKFLGVPSKLTEEEYTSLLTSREDDFIKYFIENDKYEFSVTED